MAIRRKVKVVPAAKNHDGWIDYPDWVVAESEIPIEEADAGIAAIDNGLLAAGVRGPSEGDTMHYMIMPLRRYFDFSGRSRRKEYWSFFLFVLIAMIVMMLLDTALGLGGTATGSADYGPGGASASFNLTGGTLTLIFALLIIVPGVAVAVRRAHDQDKSGWFVLIPIYNIIMMFIEGTRGPNRFGPDPKGGEDKVFT